MPQNIKYFLCEIQSIHTLTEDHFVCNITYYYYLNGKYDHCTRFTLCVPYKYNKRFIIKHNDIATQQTDIENISYEHVLENFRKALRRLFGIQDLNFSVNVDNDLEFTEDHSKYMYNHIMMFDGIQFPISFEDLLNALYKRGKEEISDIFTTFKERHNDDPIQQGLNSLFKDNVGRFTMKSDYQDNLK